MDLIVPPELEELILCSCCHLPFNDIDSIPKLLSCRHYFCLKCVNSILLKGSELYCLHCWKRTELQSNELLKSIDNLPTYNAILYLSKNLRTMLNSKIKSPPDKQNSSINNIHNNNNNNNNNSNGNTTHNTNNNNNNNNNTITNNNNQTNNSIVNGSTKLMTKKGENCLTHAMPYTLWCTKCATVVCRACAGSEEHRNHSVKTQSEARDSIHTDINIELQVMQKTLNDVHHLVLKQRDFLLKILESCTTLKTQIETELINHMPTLEISEMRENFAKAKLCLEMLEHQSPSDAIKLLSTLSVEKQRLHSKYQEMYLQCKLDDLIRNYGILFDFDLIKQALTQLHANSLTGELYNATNNGGGGGHHNPILLLANYCISQLYSRHVVSSNKQQQILNNGNSFHQHQQQQLQQQIQHQLHLQQQQQQHPPQLLSPHDTLVPSVRTYADITTNSSKPNPSHQHHSQQVIGNNNTNSNSIGVIGVNRPSVGVIGSGLNNSSSSNGNTNTLVPPPGLSYVPNDLNNLSIASLSAMQHQIQQQHSNQQQKLSSCSTTTPINSSVSFAVAGTTTTNLLSNPTIHVYPIYFFNIEMNGQPCGRILIEVRNDVAPKMAKNFGALTMGELGFGYKGCQIFQCWENESIITGDFELNNGRGGRSVFEDGFFMPDDTKILAIRGSVGMRRSQKRHDNLGLVGSQFRIILREMRGFTGIFAFVIDGLDLVEKISQTGDSAGKPQSNVVIVNCGKYQ